MTNPDQNNTSMPADAGAPPPGSAPSPSTGATPPAESASLQAETQKAAEYWDRYLRTAAEFENYKKRVARERQELMRSSQENIVAALLPVLDNLERALTAAHQHDAKNDALLQGIDQVLVQFRRTLQDCGLEEVKAHAGHPFDPNLHEAVGHVESKEHPEGAILDQLQRGYKLADRLLRPARVVVSKGPQTHQPDPASKKPKQ